MCLGWGLQGEEEGCRKKLVWFGQKVPLGFFHPIVCKNLTNFLAIQIGGRGPWV